MEVVKALASVVVGLALVIKGADYLLDGAVFVSKRLRIPEIIVGITVVAFGTSLPELVINVLASVKGNAGITVGNIVGSNIANILLILGITALISPVRSHALILRREIPANLLLVLLLALMMFLPFGGNNSISRIEGLVLLLFFAAYLYVAVFKAHAGEMAEGVEEGTLKGAALKVVGGSVALAVGSNWALNGAVSLANYLGVSEVFIGLFLIAVGTSLPELVTSSLAAVRGNPYIAIGNVSGSNIFNVGLILGLSALIRPIRIPERAAFDVTFLLISTLLFLFFTLVGRGKLLGRKRGLVFLGLYVLYVLTSLKIELIGTERTLLALKEALSHLL